MHDLEKELNALGLETPCIATYKRRSSSGRALLETDHVLFRGDFRVKLLLAEIADVSVKKGVLTLESKSGTLALALGPAAETWAARIRSPKSRIEKLGVKPGHRVSVIGIKDDEFMRELQRAGAQVSAGRVSEDSDLVFFAVNAAEDLRRFASLLPSVAPAGALWAIRRKGLADASESLTRAAGREAGLVDVKVARFSETHTAEKFVRPKATR